MAQFKKILVAVDFSDLSEKAFYAAVDLVKELNASLHVIHIVQIHSTNIPESGMVHFEELQKKDGYFVRINILDVKKSYNFPLLSRKDVIVVASVSCIYGLGSPKNFEAFRFNLSKGKKINRKDFGLTYNKILESGGLIVGDTVKLSIEIEGIKKK